MFLWTCDILPRSIIWMSFINTIVADFASIASVDTDDDDEMAYMPNNQIAASIVKLRKISPFSGPFLSSKSGTIKARDDISDINIIL
jgi:hypothetical protein